MPQVEVSSSMIVRESQKDKDPAGQLSVSFKDNSVEDYSAPMRLKVDKGQTRKVDVSHLGADKLLYIKLIDGKSFSLSLRKGSTESSQLKVGRFISAELLNVDQMVIGNPDGPSSATILIQLAAIKGS